MVKYKKSNALIKIEFEYSNNFNVNKMYMGGNNDCYAYN